MHDRGGLACGEGGASTVRTSPIGPCRWDGPPCRTVLQLLQVGIRGHRQCHRHARLRAFEAAVRRPRTRAEPARCSLTPTPARSLQYVSYGDLASTATLRQTQVSEVVASLPPVVAATGSGAARVGTLRAVPVVSAADAKDSEEQSKLWLRGPRPSAVRPVRSPSPSGVFARARASTTINCYGSQAGKTPADGCG